VSTSSRTAENDGSRSRCPEQRPENSLHMGKTIMSHFYKSVELFICRLVSLLQIFFKSLKAVF
jgi:hypothetical protein